VKLGYKEHTITHGSLTALGGHISKEDHDIVAKEATALGRENDFWRGNKSARRQK